MRKHNRKRPKAKPRRDNRQLASPREVVDELRRQYGASAAWWHGGAPGLEAGDLIRPASDTGSEAATHNVLPSLKAYQPTFVYVANNIDMAIYFAGRYPGGGSVYEVQPIDITDIDPDCTTEDCAAYICESARIIRRIDVDPRVLRRIRTKLMKSQMGQKLHLLQS